MKKTAALLADCGFLAALGVFFYVLSRQYEAVPVLWLQAGWATAVLVVVLCEVCTAGRREKRAERAPAASSLVLLSAEERAVRVWKLSGETALLIGKNFGDEQGVDLADTQFAAMIDEQHAVLNFTPTGWVIEDLASRNGVSLLRQGTEHERRIAPGMPYKVSPGDIVYIADDTRLAIR